MNKFEGAVLDAAERFVDKRLKFQEGDSNEDPDPYAERLEKAVDALRAIKSDIAKGRTIGNLIFNQTIQAGTIKAPKPSPKVGDHVRLTGVVQHLAADGEYLVELEPMGATVYFSAAEIAKLEIIRQPFKRGEVVWSAHSKIDEPFVVVNDETHGMVDVTCCRNGHFTAADSASVYERRP